MPKTRRKVLITIAQRAAVTLALADLVLYFAAVRPVDRLASGEWQNLNAARHRVQEIQGKIARLERTRDALPNTNDQLGSFVRSHVPPRRKVFSRADRLIVRLTQQSGVQLAGAPTYRLDFPQGEPFERLAIDLNVGGTFPSLLKFVHAVETASDFMLVRGFGFQPGGDAGPLEMHLMADLYISP